MHCAKQSCIVYIIYKLYLSEICDAGHTPDLNNDPTTNCVACDYGFYKPSNGIEPCTPCGDDEHNTTRTGSLYEYECILGKFCCSASQFCYTFSLKVWLTFFRVKKGNLSDLFF